MDKIDTQSLTPHEEEWLDALPSDDYTVHRHDAPTKQIRQPVLAHAEKTALLATDELKDDSWHRNFHNINNKIVPTLHTSYSVLKEAEDSHLLGDINADKAVLKQATNASITGDIETIGSVLDGASRSFIDGNVHTNVQALSDADESHIEGDINASHVLQNATKSYIRGTVQSDTALVEADESFITGERIDISTDTYNEPVGRDARGVMVAAPTITGDIADPVAVLSSTNQRGSTYNGDWHRLYDMLVDRGTDLLNGLRIFNLEKSFFNSAKDVEHYLEKLSNIYTTHRDKAQLLETFADIESIALTLEDTNTQRYHQLTNTEQYITNALADQYDIGEHVARSVIDLADDTTPTVAYLFDNSDLIAGTIDLEQFINEFYGGSDQFVYNKGFERTYHRTSDDEIVDQVDMDVTKELYKEGIDLLRQLLDGQRNQFDPEALDQFGMYRTIQEDLDAYSELIAEAERNGNHEEKQQLISERNRIKQEDMQELKEGILIGLDLYQFYETQPSFDELSRDDLIDFREGWTQLRNEYLLTDKPTYTKASRIADGIEIGSEDLGAETVQVSVWDKNLQTMPTYDEYNCCILPGFNGGPGELIEYMPGDTQFLPIQAGDKTGLAITAAMEHSQTGESYLVVNSVESSSNMFKRNSVTQAVDTAIKAYADTLGQDAVLYNTNTVNTAPEQFLEQLDYEQRTRQLQPTPNLTATPNHTGTIKWLETDLDHATGLYAPL